jgi:aminoglycoside phosphotransferase (APT) family kinase protein
MHTDEVETDAGLVRRLLAEQFAEWAQLPLERVEHAGTDNAIYRLGADKAVRLPRREGAKAQVTKEARWLPVLAPKLPLAIAAPLATGVPGQGYPLEAVLAEA